MKINGHLTYIRHVHVQAVGTFSLCLCLSSLLVLLLFLVC